MKALIITGGSIEDSFALRYIQSESWELIVSADSGLEFCRRSGLVPDRILGDFDSASGDTVAYFKMNYPDRITTFPTRKNGTDTELALSLAIELGADEVTLLGATGTRLDHVFGNIQLLKLACDAGVECAIVDYYNRIRLIGAPLTLSRAAQYGKYVSLIPFTPSVGGLTLRGFSYDLENYTMVSGNSLGISNEIEEENASISFTDGLLLVVESRDR